MTIRRARKAHTKQQVLDLMEPLVREWFESRFDELTEPQAYAIPLIHRKKNVLVSSPTGSGKTITAFLSVLNELLILEDKGELEDRIYCVYISPLKALANDIHKNLVEPLEEMGELAESKGAKRPGIRVAVRSGDTPTSERTKMLRKPPHILITTPESLALILSTPKFSQKLETVEWMIIDEIHEVCSNKRGVLLSLSLERLQGRARGEPARLGLSATQAPIEEIARFLVGYNGNKLRDVIIVEAASQKDLDLEVLCPVDDMNAYPFEIVNARMYDTLASEIESHRTTLIFTNTRSGTEHVSYKLQERGIEEIAAHHGSLSRETRLDVEDRLKAGGLKAAISSTSLELGIDIGYIDLVCQIGSPKSIAKGLQRIGRSGHAIHATPKGRFIVFENDDLVECAVLVKSALDNRIDRVRIPKLSLDVLAQVIVGMSLEARWRIADVLRLVRRSHCYHALTKRDFDSVLNYLGGQTENIYGKIWLDREEGVIGRKRGSRMIYYLNLGTIPDESSYRVYSERGVPLGKLSERFVERMANGDIFVLGGKSYEYVKGKGMRIFVRDAKGRKPTVPSWTGEMLPRSYDLSLEIGRFRAELKKRLARHEQGDLVDWLIRDYHVDHGSAVTMLNYVREQLEMIPFLPTHEQVLVEGYMDQTGARNLIFHYCFGRRVNDALGRAYALALSNRLGCNVRVSITDDNFMLAVPKRVGLKGITELVTPENLEPLLRSSVKHTEIFRQRFRHCAGRSFMILRNYKGKQISVGRQQSRSAKVLEVLLEHPDFPVIKETYREIMHDVMDLEGAMEVVQGIASGRIKGSVSDFSNVPSPFAHNIVLMGMSDMVLMEDRSALLKELHRKVLERVIPKENIDRFRFKPEQVEAYFKGKVPRIARKADIVPLVRLLGATSLFQQKGRNVYDHADAPIEKVRAWCQELANQGKLVPVHRDGIVWVERGEFWKYHTVYARRPRAGRLGREMARSLGKGKTSKELAKEFDITTKEVMERMRSLEPGHKVYRKGFRRGQIVWGTRRPRRGGLEEAMDSIITTHLGTSGPRTNAELAYEIRMEEGAVGTVLKELETEGIVASGSFVVGDAIQYMLASDVRALESRDEIPMNKVRQHMLRKHFEGMETIDDYFDRLGEASMVYDVFARAGRFDLDDWLRMRRDDEIIEGRFVRRSVRYVRKEDVQTFVSAYRSRRLSQNGRDLLGAIRKEGRASSDKLAKKMGVESRDLKEQIDELDRALYVIRGFTGADGWNKRNIYEALDVEPGDRDEAMERVVQRCIRIYGPVPYIGIKGYTGFRTREIDTALARLESEGLIEKVSVEGMPGKSYILKEELPELLAVSVERVRDRMRILTLMDPYTQPMWVEITSKYGDRWIYPVLKDGMLAGAIEKWQMSGCVEVREIELVDKGLLPELLDELDQMMVFYRMSGVEVLRVRSVMGVDVVDLDAATTKVFKDHGYMRVNDFLAKGKIVDRSWRWERILAYLFWKQRIPKSRRLRTPLHVVSELTGVRSDMSAAVRCREFTPLRRYMERGELHKGHMIPEVLLHVTESEAELFQAAKAKRIDDDMEHVLSVIQARGLIGWSELTQESVLGHERTLSAAKRLRYGVYVMYTGHNKTFAVERSGIPKHEARKEVIWKTFQSFGIFSAERLYQYLRGGYLMRELRSILAELEDDGKLVKGYFVEGSDTLHWLVKEDLDRVGRTRFSDTFVIANEDRLASYLHDEIRQRFGMGACWVVFRGAEMTGAFVVRKRKGELIVVEHQGGAREKKALRELAHKMGKRVIYKEQEEADDEWEIAEYVAKTR